MLISSFNAICEIVGVKKQLKSKIFFNHFEFFYFIYAFIIFTIVKAGQLVNY